MTGRPSNAGFLPSLSVLPVGQNSQGRLMPKDLPDLGLEELHAVLLDMLKNVDALCQKYNLRYVI